MGVPLGSHDSIGLFVVFFPNEMLWRWGNMLRLTAKKLSIREVGIHLLRRRDKKSESKLRA